MKTQHGFSLLEMAIVLSIIGAIIGLAGPSLFDRKAETRKVFRDFIIAGKDLKSRAKLTGLTYRLAFQLDEGKQAWWVEKSSHPTMIDKKKYEAEREKAKESDHDEKEKKPADFDVDLTIFKKKQVLPKGFKFKQIESGTQDLVFVDGMAYIHFFSQGLIETTALQIEDPKKNIWTLIINPITGQTDVVPEEKSLKDLAR